MLSYLRIITLLALIKLANKEMKICRLVLRCRSEARARFASIRSDVMVKLELLDNKHVQDIVHQVCQNHVYSVQNDRHNHDSYGASYPH